jgi:hypothetical protein
VISVQAPSLHVAESILYTARCNSVNWEQGAALTSEQRSKPNQVSMALQGVFVLCPPGVGFTSLVLIPLVGPRIRSNHAAS